MKTERFLVSIFFLVSLFSSSLVYSQETRKNVQTNKVVRVGYFYTKGYSVGCSSYSIKSGYAYEYLQKIAYYNGWNYEYVYGTWDSLYEMLKTGDIDLFTDVSKSTGRATDMFVSNEPMGVECFYLYRKNSLEASDKEKDIHFYEGKRIGVQKGSIQSKLLKDTLLKNKVNATVIPYKGNIALSNALSNDEIDAVVLLDTSLESDIHPVIRLGSSDFYFAVSVNRKDILDELNYAQGKILQENPYYHSYLQRKYFTSIGLLKVLDSKEVQYLKENPVLRVGYINDYMPYTGTKDGRDFVGLYREVFDSISQAYKVSFVYRSYNSDEEMLNDLHSKKIDIVCPIYKEEWWAEKGDYMLTDSIAYCQNRILFTGRYNEGTTNKIAITDKLPLQKIFVEKYYPYTNVIYYPDFKSCLKAVFMHKANSTLINSSVIEGYRKKYGIINRLSSIVLPQPINLSAAVRRDDILLLCIINKGISMQDDNSISSSLIRYSQDAVRFSWNEFVQTYYKVLLLLSVVLIITMYFLIKKIVKIIKENKESQYDTLTHLYNRRTLDFYLGNAIKKALDQSEPFSLMMFDIDDFKLVNDKYGHDCGDKILKMVSAILNKSVRDSDYVFRWGGEELLILLSGPKSVAVTVSERIRKSVETSYVEYLGENIHVTVTCGVASFVSGASVKDMLDKADERLYYGKKHGKNQVVSIDSKDSLKDSGTETNNKQN